MNADRKKQLRDAYKEKPASGGVCMIRCSGNGRTCIQPTRNIDGLRNRFNFAIAIGSAPDPSLQAELEAYGPSSFSFSVLDQIEKKESQTDREFADDIDALYEIWREKAKNGELN